MTALRYDTFETGIADTSPASLDRKTAWVMARLIRFARDGATDPVIMERSREIVYGVDHRDHREQVRRLFLWFRAHASYTYDPFNMELIKTPRAILAEIDAGRGDDCDSAVLLAAMLLSIGIQARFLTWGPSETGPFKHVAVKAYVQGEWALVDWVAKDAREAIMVASTGRRQEWPILPFPANRGIGKVMIGHLPDEQVSGLGDAQLPQGDIVPLPQAQPGDVLDTGTDGRPRAWIGQDGRLVVRLTGEDYKQALAAVKVPPEVAAKFTAQELKAKREALARIVPRLDALAGRDAQFLPYSQAAHALQESGDQGIIAAGLLATVATKVPWVTEGWGLFAIAAIVGLYFLVNAIGYLIHGKREEQNQQAINSLDSAVRVLEKQLAQAPAEQRPYLENAVKVLKSGREVIAQLSRESSFWSEIPWWVYVGLGAPVIWGVSKWVGRQIS